ncbi:hypothetical protein Taro_027030 [Colocasia esculenta]|uniref:Uncharacterized protein n=1 Tax=Colocasia esculenta TaxID=4460 RepID=A0A843VT44_COLES|nr:hypothetical protein [Colocasia esculenta]
MGCQPGFTLPVLSLGKWSAHEMTTPPPRMDDATPRFVHAGSVANQKEMNCDFFMWCDKVQSFVNSTTTCEKDEKIKQLENRIAWLEDELRGSKSLINKAKVVVQSLPNTFAFLSILDKDGDDGSDAACGRGRLALRRRLFVLSGILAAAVRWLPVLHFLVCKNVKFDF